MRERYYTTQKAGPRVAIVGHRGVPSNYGGFETFAEEVGSCLANLGCRVLVYCRTQYFAERPSVYKSMHLVYLPTIANKVLDTFVHTFISVMHVVVKNTADVVVVVNVGNAPFAALAKLFGKKVIFCVDGLDWQRKKWGMLARTYLRVCSYFAKWVAHEVVTDAGSVQEFYRRERKTNSTLIPYGTDVELHEETDAAVLQKYGLKNKAYFIYVARFEPENNPLLVVQAYVDSGSNVPLVMVGDNRYNKAFVEQIKKAANDRVIFTGYVFGSAYKILQKNALAYVRAAEVGGASPALIEAMGRSSCVVSNDKPENREIVDGTGIFFELNRESLARVFRDITAHPEKAVELGRRAGQRAMVLYSWDKIAFEYFKLIKQLWYKKEPANVTASKQVIGYHKRILITGASGMLGQAVYEEFVGDYTVLATSRKPTETWVQQLDVTNLTAFSATVDSFRPDYIIHLAAMTNLEACERDPKEAYAVNALSAKYAAQLATKAGAKLIYISSSGMFDGMQKWYTEKDDPTPTSVYGLTKQVGGLFVEFYAPNHLTVRTGWAMGGGPLRDKKFTSYIIKQLVEGQRELKVVADKFGTIAYSRDVAKTMRRLIEKNASGLYNVANSGSVSRYDLAVEMVRVLGYQGSVKVTPVSSDYFASTFTVHRPEFENLNCDKLTRSGANVMRPWKEAVEDYLKRDYAFAFRHAPDVPATEVLAPA